MNGICACGADNGGVTLVELEDDHIIAWELDKIHHFLDANEGIQIVNDGTIKYLGVWVDEDGERITGSSDDDRYYFAIKPVGSGVMKDNKIYASSSMMTQDDTQWIAKRHDNFTISVQCDGQLEIEVYAQSGDTRELVYTIAVQVEKVKDDYLYGWDVGYVAGESGYSKCAKVTDEILSKITVDGSTNNDYARLWFDLNTEVGHLWLVDTMPCYQFEFIDEEKHTLSGFMQLVVASGIRKTVVEVTDFNIVRLLQDTIDGIGDLAEMFSGNEGNREMARIVVDYLESVEYESWELLPDFVTIDAFETFAESEEFIGYLIKLTKQIDKFLGGKKDTVVHKIVKYVRENNIPVTENILDENGKFTISGWGIALSTLYDEIGILTKAVNAKMVMENIETGIMSLDGVSDELKEEIIKVLEDESNSADETIWAIADNAASAVTTKLLKACPPAYAIFVTLKAGSTLMGYEEFETGLAELLVANNNYDAAKARLLNALNTYKTSPTTVKYQEVISAVNNYKLITLTCISHYADWRIAESTSLLKQWFRNEETYIKEAAATRSTSKEKCEKYCKRIQNGAMR